MSYIVVFRRLDKHGKPTGKIRVLRDIIFDTAEFTDKTEAEAMVGDHALNFAAKTGIATNYQIVELTV